MEGKNGAILRLSRVSVVAGFQVSFESAVEDGWEQGVRFDGGFGFQLRPIQCPQKPACYAAPISAF